MQAIPQRMSHGVVTMAHSCSSPAASLLAPRSAAASRTASRLKLRHGTGGRRLRSSSVVTQAKPVKVSAEELEVALADREVPLIVDFYANWCGPCVLLAKELEQVAEDLGETVRILKVDTDENPELSTQLQIQGLPTMVFVGTDGAKPALRTEGLLPAATIKEIVAKELS